MKHLAGVITLAFLASMTLLAGCGYSLVEQGIRSDIPASFRTHAAGITVTPTDADVQDAIALGKQSKDGQALQYAYLAKAKVPDPTYINVATPLYLIAEHAREQAREYREVDPEFVACARNVRAVRLSLSQQFMSSVTYRTYQFERSLILLRDRDPSRAACCRSGLPRSESVCRGPREPG